MFVSRLSSRQVSNKTKNKTKNKNKNKTKTKNKILIIGDSFIGPFNLIEDDNMYIYKFSGKSMKGITKKEDKDREKIVSLVNNNKNIKCLIFNFGQVDLYFSYYYKKFIKNEKFMMTSIIKKIC